MGSPKNTAPAEAVRKNFRREQCGLGLPRAHDRLDEDEPWLWHRAGRRQRKRLHLVGREVHTESRLQESAGIGGQGLASRPPRRWKAEGLPRTPGTNLGGLLDVLESGCQWEQVSVRCYPVRHDDQPLDEELACVGKCHSAQRLHGVAHTQLIKHTLNEASPRPAPLSSTEETAAVLRVVDLIPVGRHAMVSSDDDSERLRVLPWHPLRDQVLGHDDVPRQPMR